MSQTRRSADAIGNNRVRGFWTAVLAVEAGVAIVLVAFAAAQFLRRPPTAKEIRIALLRELQPVTLANCTLERFGGRNDGGYLFCGNLLGNIQSAYSYGIAGDDNWGCTISRRFNVPVHQYDCFDPTEPACPGGRPQFHHECVGPRMETIDTRLFDSVTNQVRKNGDAGKTLVVKMDVEGAEIDSLNATSDEILATIDQLAIELHAADERYLDLVRKLKKHFHVVHLHFNNSQCTTQFKPFPTPIYEVTFVNKRIAVVDRSAPPPPLPNKLDAQNDLYRPDCQSLVPVE